MEYNKMISDAVVGEDYLEHYGVKGMHWGVWNAETAARYSHVAKRGLKASGQAAVRGAKAVKKAVGNHMAVKKVERAAKKQRAHDRAKQRRELGMDPYKYAKLRNRTLKSHDPEVVMRGMHTLTDDELEEKIKRLQREDVVAKLASSRAQDRHRVNQARSQAISANPAYRLGEAYVKKVGDRALNSIFPKPEKGGGKKNKGGSNDNQNATSAKQSSGSNKNPEEKKKKKKKKEKKDKAPNRMSYKDAADYINSYSDAYPSSSNIKSGEKYVYGPSRITSADDPSEWKRYNNTK